MSDFIPWSSGFVFPFNPDFLSFVIDLGLVVVGLLGNLVVAVGGLMAIYTMYVAMKQAKIEGDLKKAAAREARKAQRASRRK